MYSKTHILQGYFLVGGSIETKIRALNLIPNSSLKRIEDHVVLDRGGTATGTPKHSNETNVAIGSGNSKAGGAHNSQGMESVAQKGTNPFNSSSPLSQITNAAHRSGKGDAEGSLKIAEAGISSQMTDTTRVPTPHQAREMLQTPRDWRKLPRKSQVPKAKPKLQMTESVSWQWRQS